MFSQSFAQYILNQGLLTPKQVQQALENISAVKVKLGVLAINQGSLTATQVEKIYRLQHSIDKRFGEIALDEGYLTQEELSILLNTQESGHLNFSQIIVDNALMNLEQLEHALADYKKISTLDQQSDLLFLKEFICRQLNCSQHDKDVEVYCDYIALFLRALVRFLDASPLLIPMPCEQDKDTLFVTQVMTGDVNLHSSFTAENSILLELACRYSGEKINEMNELAIDSLGEFLNVTNGLFCINLSNRGLELDLHPQMVTRSATFFEKSRCAVGIDTGFGTIKLVLGGLK